MHTLALFIILAVPFIYVAPIITAGVRHHPQGLAITIVTIFLGWTFIGWVVALTWACTATKE